MPVHKGIKLSWWSNDSELDDQFLLQTLREKYCAFSRFWELIELQGGDHTVEQ